MKNYIVTIPVAGYATMEVSALNEEEAIRKAMDDITKDDIQEWDAYEQLCQGNVMMFPVNDADAEEVES